MCIYSDVALQARVRGPTSARGAGVAADLGRPAAGFSWAGGRLRGSLTGTRPHHAKDTAYSGTRSGFRGTEAHAGCSGDTNWRKSTQHEATAKHS